MHDGQVLDLPGAPRVIGMPGHSPGSIAIHVPAADAVFVGDGLTTRHVLTGPPARSRRRSPTTRRRRSRRCAVSRAIDATWVLPGHGTPCNGGVDAAIREVERAAAASGP